MPIPDTGPVEPAPGWMFKAGAQLYGPVPEAKLLELVSRREVVASTEVAREGAPFAPAGSFASLLVHLQKAEARARVEAEVAEARRAASRRRALQWALALAGGLAAVTAAVAAAWFLAVKHPWSRRSELLADLGGGLAVTVVRVGADRRREAEIDVPAFPAEQAPKRAATPRPVRSAGAVPRPVAAAAEPPVGGEAPLALARYDAARIEEVVARHRASLASCVREEAARSPELAGEIPIEFAIGNDGRLAKLWIGEPRVASGPLRDCLLARLREWSFDRFEGERPVVSLAFRIGGR